MFPFFDGDSMSVRRAPSVAGARESTWYLNGGACSTRRTSRIALYICC